MVKQQKPVPASTQHAPGSGPVALATPAPVTPAPEPKEKVNRYAKSTWGDQDVITLVPNKGIPNPKKPSGASYHRFALYKNGMTVLDYVKACVESTGKAHSPASKARLDLRWDVRAGFITIAPATK